MAQGSAHIGKDRYRTEIVVGGHAITADEPEALGGANLGPAPYDLLLAALGACTAITLRPSPASRRSTSTPPTGGSTTTSRWWPAPWAASWAMRRSRRWTICAASRPRRPAQAP